MRTPKNLMQHEWMGLSATVVEASDPTHRGITGTIVDETLNTISLRRDDHTVMLPKGVTLQVELGESVARLETGQMRFRPEDRIKRLRRR